ncbi:MULTISPECIES: glycosyltransferase family 2 protein [unclassified Vibrio]|uniref:glycosyltransferase family 2 protein n=1 Tax=unclassified Vibrio TaxID=2614977 RepID=UPI000CC25F86|nr:MULTISPECIES: glycosyltransferase family 2 protein [unclassified Vibrio]PMK18711.1 glycosyl transferase family 2 [Vibrio sp. 10N.261.54.C3]TKF38452.1 glycosyltransferase family 2 protein [Vibrio sp. F13]
MTQPNKKPRVYISVVSHGSDEVIKKLKCLEVLVDKFIVIVKSNTPCEDLSFLCGNDFHWIDSDYGRGFGENNNIVFDYCLNDLGMNSDDIFIVLNPDVLILHAEILKLVDSMLYYKDSIASINLYRDVDLSIEDCSIRRFPNLLMLAKSLLGNTDGYVLNKREILIPTSVDWAAGSFLAFKSSHYKRLGGFDTGYFMYCEDIDICYRSYFLGEAVRYYPDIKAVHLAAHNNRKIFSKHFYWHIKSSLHFLLKKHFR